MDGIFEASQASFLDPPHQWNTTLPSPNGCNKVGSIGNLDSHFRCQFTKIYSLFEMWRSLGISTYRVLNTYMIAQKTSVTNGWKSPQKKIA